MNPKILSVNLMPSNLLFFTVPYVNPKIQPNYDHNYDIHGHRTTVIVLPTSRRPHFVSSNVKTIDDSINRGILFDPKNRNDVDDTANADVATTSATSGAGAVVVVVAAADAPAAIKPTNAYNNRNRQSNINSLFMPASTSKYPIKQSTITEDFRERFRNFVDHWTNAFVYLSRK